MRPCDICKGEITPDGGCGCAAVVLLRRATSTQVRKVTRAPIGAVSASLRAKHHDDLRRLASWAMAKGRSCDRDVAALCLEELESRRTSGRLVLLDRMTVNQIMWADVWNLSQALGTRLSEHWQVELWTVLGWLDGEHLLDPASDPLPVLREPLRCYALLGEDGLPMLEGVDVDFVCQCYVPYDPTLPPGIGLHIVGRDHESFEPLLTHARLRPRSTPATTVDLEPLYVFARRMRRGRSAAQIHVEEFSFAGVVPAYRRAPELWIYHHEPTSRRGFESLVLDAEGSAWMVQPDRRRKVGFRWIAVSDFAAIYRAGARRDDDEPNDDGDWSGWIGS